MAGALPTLHRPAAAPVTSRPLLRGWLHVGAALGMAAGGPMLAVRAPNPGSAAALSIYSLCMVSLFGVSALFHRVRWGPRARRVMRRADHCTIFLGIAGTYTAVAALALSGWAQILVLVLVWTGAAAGIVIRQVWLDLPKWAVALPYVVVGWSALAVLPQLLHGLGAGGFALLVAGGAAYSCGALVYARRRPDPVPGVFGYHEVFHTLTVVGAALHYCVLAFFALPAH
ncbi:MAG TPA: hemolysin III family protein [Acidimicrobiales bacterium]|nr:hemolysin III family protein [Acidimicrobiales bacterium]